MSASTDTTARTTLREYVGASSKDEAFVAECEASAEAMVADLLPAGDVVTAEAKALRRQAVLATGANLWQRRRRLSEASGFIDGQLQAAPERPTRDPLDQARHILAPLLGPGIA